MSRGAPPHVPAIRRRSVAAIVAALAAAAALAGGCARGRDAAARGATGAATIGARARPAMDTSLDRQLAAFRARVGPRPEHLDGFRSRDSLVLAFAHAVQARDTAALRRLALDPAEFAWLYYPDAPLARPPYELDPGTMWMQISAESQRGYVRVLRTYGGNLGFRSYRCEDRPMVSGAVRLWNACAVTHLRQGEPVTEPLFGSIVEREGWYKLVGLSNRL